MIWIVPEIRLFLCTKLCLYLAWSQDFLFKKKQTKSLATKDSVLDMFSMTSSLQPDFFPLGQKSMNHTHRVAYRGSLGCSWLSRMSLDILFWLTDKRHKNWKQGFYLAFIPNICSRWQQGKLWDAVRWQNRV